MTSPKLQKMVIETPILFKIGTARGGSLNKRGKTPKQKKDLSVNVLVLGHLMVFFSGDGFKSSSCLHDEDSEDAFGGDIHDCV